MDASELSNHRTKESCWIVIDRNVYDVTSFIDIHPGGPALILKYAGQDATAAFHEVHANSILEDHITKENHLGPVVGKVDKMTNVKSRDALVDMPSSSLPNLATRVTLDDFHDVAKAILPGRAYIYASSASNNERRVQHYNTVWSRLFFRPRIMRNVSIINPTTHMLSFKSRYPFFIAPMGLVGTVHAEGELALARAAAQRGIHYCISTAATKSHEEVITSFRKEQKILETVNGEHQSEPFFQLYVNSQRHVTQELLRKIRRLGYKGLLITVDTPVIGKRNADRELQAREMVAAGLDDKAAAPVPAQKTRVEGGRAPPGVLSSSLNWNDLVWIRKEWDGPIVLKGVQCAADVKMAADAGVHGVYLSNHGGRQLRDAPSSLHTLLETRALYPEVLGKIEIFVDGGFSTGADILKAICLGAKAVGIGRPFIYAVAGYGVEGALKTIDILAEEIEIAMRLLGVTNLDQLGPDLVNLSHIQSRLFRL